MSQNSKPLKAIDTLVYSYIPKGSQKVEGYVVIYIAMKYGEICQFCSILVMSCTENFQKFVKS